MCLKGLKSCFSTKKAKKKSGDPKIIIEGQENQQNQNSFRNQNASSNHQNHAVNQNNPNSNRNSSVLSPQSNFQNFSYLNNQHVEEDHAPKIEQIKDNRIKINTIYESKNIEVSTRKLLKEMKAENNIYFFYNKI